MKTDSISKEEFCDVLSGCNLRTIKKWTEFANKISVRENLDIEFDNEFGRIIDIMFSAYDDIDPRDPNKTNPSDTLIIRIWAARIKNEEFLPAKINCPYHRDDESEISRWQKIFSSYESNLNLSYKEKVQIMSSEINISTSQRSSSNNPSKPISHAKYKRYLKQAEKREARMCQCKTN